MTCGVMTIERVDINISTAKHEKIDKCYSCPWANPHNEENHHVFKRMDKLSGLNEQVENEQGHNARDN
ncbi:hypothetical protein D3C84_651780 [compost metagenome]